MKPTQNLLLLATLSAGLPLSALGQGTVSTEAFIAPSSSFSFASSVSDLRVSNLAEADTTEQTTHILIEGLVPVEAGSSVVTSSYRAINLSSGTTTEVGSLFFTMPSGATTSSATSPIVGIVARAGDWSDFNPTTPDVALGGGSGAAAASEGSVSLSILKGGTEYTGSAAYTVIDENSVEIDDFSLTAGSSVFEFYGTTLSLWGTEYYGVVQSKSPANTDATMLTIRFTNMPDGDNDGVPDWTDTESGFPGLKFREYSYTSELGWAFGLGGGWGYSLNFGTHYYSSMPWIYIQGPPSGVVGWARFVQRTNDDSSIVYLYSPTLGWLYTQDILGGWYFRYSANDWFHFFVDPPSN
jgi:hypothetical protein